MNGLSLMAVSLLFLPHILLVISQEFTEDLVISQLFMKDQDQYLVNTIIHENLVNTLVKDHCKTVSDDQVLLLMPLSGRPAVVP